MATERKTYTYTPFTYDDYAKSQEVVNAENKKANAENALSNYGDFTYSNQGMFNDVMNKILNREKFSYDLNGDALYQQYKDKYIQQGKLASADVMGQASAMTGGYGNSYAASVGNQAYQASLQQLNDVIPELYQMAYDRYNQEGQDLYNQYGLLSNERSTEYGMWGDKRNTLVADRDYYSTEANNAFSRDYGMYSDDRNLAHGEHTTKEGYKYQDVADANAYNQWEASFNESVRQFNETANKTTPVTLDVDDYAKIEADAELYKDDRYALNAYLAEMESQGLPVAISDRIFAKYFPEEEKKGTSAPGGNKSTYETLN